jgi:hypothetical protein
MVFAGAQVIVRRTPAVNVATVLNEVAIQAFAAVFEFAVVVKAHASSAAQFKCFALAHD